MKIFVVFILLASVTCCFGQTDTNIIAIGDWSKTIFDSHKCALRGRLLVYDDKDTQKAEREARVYVELQHVETDGWNMPLELYFDFSINFQTNNSYFEMQDEHSRPIKSGLVTIGAIMPDAYDVLLPCDSTIRIRADYYSIGSDPDYSPKSRPHGLSILGNGGYWFITQNATNEFSLSATLKCVASTNTPSKHYNWVGTLHLPTVRIPRQNK
jgi:hypothetical protein